MNRTSICRAGWKTVAARIRSFVPAKLLRQANPCDKNSVLQIELKDYRPPTKKEYVRHVCKLAEHFQCDPATLCENQLRQYFLFLRQHKHYKSSPMKAAKFALRCFYLQCLKVSG